MSVLPPKADIPGGDQYVRFAPKADIVRAASFWLRGSRAYESDDLNGKSDHNRTFVSMGDFTTEEAKEYFDSVYFAISDEKWRAMGCHNLQCEEEQDCAICGERFEDSPFKVHKCRTD